MYSKIYKSNLEIAVNNSCNISKLKNKNIFVTGATGLIGSALVDSLLYANEIRDLNSHIFIGIRNKNKAHDRFKEQLNNKNLTFLTYNALQEISFDTAFDYIIHAASNAHPAAYATQPVETMTSNFLGMNNLLQYSIKHGVKRVLYVSSSEVYGEKQDAQLYKEEDYFFVDILNPRNCYPSSKRATETLCTSYAKQHNLDIVIARPGHVYGPTFSETDTRAFAQFARNSLNNQDIVMKSAGTQLRSYTYVFDAVSALITILTNGESNQAYNVSNSESIASIRELAQAFAEYNGKHIVFENPSDLEAKGYNLMSNSALDSSKLENLGWRGVFDLKSGVQNTMGILHSWQIS